jgi:hypothetical protein
LYFPDQQSGRRDTNLEVRGPRHRDEGARAVLGIEQRREKCAAPAEAEQVDAPLLTNGE